MGEFHDFPWQTSSLTVPKITVGEGFCLSKKCYYGKSFWIRRGCHVFPSKFFCPKSPKTSWVSPSVFQKCSGIKMFWITGVRQFCRLFCLTMPKNFAGGPLFFGNVLVSRNFWITSYHHFVEIFCLMSPKIIVGETVCVSEILGFQSFLDNSGVLLLSIVFVSHC